MRAGRLGAPRPRRATSPASRPRRTTGTRRPAGRAARSRDSGRQRAPGTLASSRRPARSPRMANCSTSTCGRSGRPGRGRPLPAARYVERRATAELQRDPPQVGIPAPRGGAQQLVFVVCPVFPGSHASESHSFSVSTQAGETGMQGSRADPLRVLYGLTCRTARPHPNMTDRPLPPVVTVATSARARRTLRFVSERQLSARPIVGDNCERLRGNTNPAGRRAFPGAAA